MKVVAPEHSVQSTGASRRLRSSDRTPAIICGTGTEPKLIELNHNALYHILEKGAFYSLILDVEVAGRAEKALLRDFQLYPLKQPVLHVDFQRMSTKEKIHVKIPLHFLNQKTAPGAKLGRGIVSRVLNDVRVSCLLADLPEFTKVDLSTLKIDQTLRIADLELPKGMTIFAHGGDENPTAANISMSAGEKSAVAEGGVAAAGGDKPAT